MAKDKKSWISVISEWALVICIAILFLTIIIYIFVPQKTMCIETLNATEQISVDKANTLNDAIPFFNRCTNACSNAFASNELFECYKLCFDKIQVKEPQVIK